MIKNPELKEAAKTVSDAVSRAWGLANALSFMSECNHTESTLRFSQLTDALEEMAGAMKDALSPAIQAADDLLAAFEEEPAE